MKINPNIYLFRSGSLQYSNDGNTLLSCSPDKTILLFDLKSKKPITFLKGHTSKVYYAKFNENNSLIASGGEDSQIMIWDMRKQAALKKIEGLTKNIKR